jgi:hypothetical protein
MTMVHSRRRRTAWARHALLASLAASVPAYASDGSPDTAGRFPAVAGYYEFFVYLPEGGTPEVAYAEESCTGSLIADRVVLTAAHCTAYNYTQDVGITGYYSRVWVSFDTVATANDFRCFLVETGGPYTDFLTGTYACDPATRTTPAPRFVATEVIGRDAGGVAVAHGLTHPAFLRPALRPDGLRAKRATQNLQLAPDVGALLLAEPVHEIQPLRLRDVGSLEAIPDLAGTQVVSVGYGLNWAKRTGGRPTPGLGPMTDLGGGSGTRRIAEVGPIANVYENSLVPRQDVGKGDDTVCFGDSGSPLFLMRDGAVEPVISAVLSGATNWCQGSRDPWYRIDQAEAQEFLACVVSHQYDAASACRECSAEAALGLCAD